MRSKPRTKAVQQPACNDHLAKRGHAFEQASSSASWVLLLLLLLLSAIYTRKQNMSIAQRHLAYISFRRSLSSIAANGCWGKTLGWILCVHSLDHPWGNIEKSPLDWRRTGEGTGDCLNGIRIPIIVKNNAYGALLPPMVCILCKLQASVGCRYKHNETGDILIRQLGLHTIHCESKKSI